VHKQLRKSTTDKSISGVCGGIAEYFGLSSFMVRILFIVLPANILIYIILVSTLPDPPPRL
jgi:phage shock protein C